MIADVIRSHALARPEHPAVVCPDRRPLSYAGLERQIEDIGAQLRRAGFSVDSRIGVALLNGPEAVLAIVAVACHGAVVPINNSLADEELRQLFERVRLDAVLLTQATPVRIRATANELGVALLEAALSGGDEIELTLQAQEKPLAASAEPRLHSIALILQTSGTTGRPKLVPITHANLEAEAAKISSWFNLTPNDRCLNILPLCYAHGLREALFPPILTGGSIARPENHANLDMLTWLDTLKPTWYSNFPIFHQSLYELITANGGERPAHHLRFVLSAGTPLKPALQQGLEQALGVPVLEFFGIGEAGHMTANLPGPGKRRPGTCGIALPNEMIIALDGRALPAGEIGEVLVRSPTVIKGYLDDAQSNAEAFVDGWFRTGDLGSVDEDGFLSIHGRRKELINRGGEKISPVEVERALLRHPAVADAAACGIPHARLGEEVAAAVVLRNGSTATPSELRTFLCAHLTPFKVPRHISLMRELPKDVTGKTQRTELSASLATTAAAVSGSAASSQPHCPLAADLMQLWRELLQCQSIGLDDDFFANGGDSLLAVQMRLAIEKLTGVLLPDETLYVAPTIRQLTQAIAECNQDRTTTPLTEWSTSDGRAFFYFHGDFISAGIYVRRLVELVGNAARVISIAPHGLGREPVPASIEAMASERLPLILAAQPRGPYRLGGYCNGGAVALEVARLLHAAGHRIELVALIDVPIRNASTGMRLLQRGLTAVLPLVVHDPAQRKRLTAECVEFAWVVQDKACRFWQMNQTTRRAKLRAKLNETLKTFGRASPSPLAALQQLSPGLCSPGLCTRYFSALALYFPEPLDVPIAYYSAEHSGRHLPGISSQGEVVRIPADHFSCVTTHMHLIVEHLRKSLARDVAKPASIDEKSTSKPRRDGRLLAAPLFKRGLLGQESNVSFAASAVSSARRSLLRRRRARHGSAVQTRRCS
jgi:acyl-CoA synthetase (AMP-forming)/AMP-acid ligase II/thioesterase domain-containing protein